MYLFLQKYKTENRSCHFILLNYNKFLVKLEKGEEKVISRELSTFINITEILIERISLKMYCLPC